MATDASRTAAAAEAAGATPLTTGGDLDHPIPAHLIGVVMHPKVAGSEDLKDMTVRNRTSRLPKATRAVVVSISSYRSDALYPGVVRAVETLLARGKVVAPVDVLVGVGLLDPAQLVNWRSGRVPYLEEVINCNLPRLSRLLRILRFHVHDLRLVPSSTAYLRRGKGPKQRLPFIRRGDGKIEAAYSPHFLWPGTGPYHPPASKVQAATDETGARS